MIAYVCNKCGRVITNKDIMQKTTKLTLSTGRVGSYSEMHLCDDCIEKVINFIKESEGK